MLHLYDRATMARALTLELDPSLRRLLTERIHLLGEDLIDWTEYLVVESGDSEIDIIRAVGFSPLFDPLNGVRFPDPAFQPSWDWLEHQEGWFEMVVTFGSTFAYCIFVADAPYVERPLRELLNSFAKPK